ncbi:MAG: DUF2062 domain-containing protein [Kiritimatiellaeota bacterium]|nr:DUF2062 domain-containing protein [Kiritimatiellota bacterium]
MRIFIHSSDADSVDLSVAGGHELVFDASSRSVETRFHPGVSLELAETAERLECEMVASLPNGVSGKDFEALLAALPDADRPTGVVVGRRRSVKQGNDRSVFLLRLLTGESIPDFASPIAVYPTKLLLAASNRLYESPNFAVDILVFASRSGYALRQADVECSDSDGFDAGEPLKLSYFILKSLSILSPIPHKRLCERNFQREAFKKFLLHPLKFIAFLLKENASPAGLATAAAVGMFFGTLALPGLHTAAIIYVSVKLRLNKMMSVNISHLCMPPFVPIACVELGHFALNGEWLFFDSIGIFVDELPSRLLEWLLGSVILAPLNAVVFWCLIYAVARFASGLRTSEN